MRGRRGPVLCILLAVAAAAVLTLPSPALAQSGPRVTLNSSRTKVPFGKSITLWGRISRPPPGQGLRGQTVRIYDVERDVVVARARTDRRGRYDVSLAPRRRLKMRARWVPARTARARSRLAIVRVRARVKVSLSRTKLFDRTVAKGIVRPAHPGRRVRVRLLRYGRRVATRRVELGPDGRRFRARFLIRKPGTYRTKATFVHEDHLRGRDASRRRTPPLPALHVGSRRGYVRLLERRLRKLEYHITGVNRRYDRRTRDAVIAFNKVQGSPRSGSVGAGTWRALASPKRPHPRFRRARYHIEIDQTKQVVYLVRRGKVTAIVHTSTGANGATRDGTFRVHRKLAGYSSGGLYYPSYFDGLRALHGWSSVPTYPASHGCARLPMWTAKWMFRKAPLGTQVRVYH